MGVHPYNARRAQFEPQLRCLRRQSQASNSAIDEANETKPFLDIG